MGRARSLNRSGRREQARSPGERQQRKSLEEKASISTTLGELYEEEIEEATMHSILLERRIKRKTAEVPDGGGFHHSRDR